MESLCDLDLGSKANKDEDLERPPAGLEGDFLRLVFSLAIRFEHPQMRQ